MSGVMGGGYQRDASRRQKEILAEDLGYDDGGAFALLAVAGFDIAGEMRGENGTFGIVFAIIDCGTGEQIETSEPLPSLGLHGERAKWIRRVRALNHEQEAA